MALNSQLLTVQILTNDDQVLILCLSYSITTVPKRLSKSNFIRNKELALSNYLPETIYKAFWKLLDLNYFSHRSFSNIFHSNTKNNFTKNNLIRLGNCFPCLVVVPKFVFTKVSFNISTNYLLSSIQYISCFQANNFDTTWHSD